MQTPGREPSMEDILASIKKVIAEEKELRGSKPAQTPGDEQLAEDIGEAEEDVLELDEPLAPPADLGPPLIDEQVAGQSRQALEQLQTVAASVPPAPPIISTCRGLFWSKSPNRAWIYSARLTPLRSATLW